MSRLLVFGLLLFQSCLPTMEKEWQIYYDISTNQTIETIRGTNPRLKYYKGAQKLFRIGFGPIPCSCQDFTCGCCAGVNIEYFNFNRRACMNFTYDPQEFSMGVNMLMNDESLYEQSISGKNPPPACMPIPIPYLPSIDMCMKFFNIHTPGYNIFMCMDFETRIERAPILVLHFDCMQMGMDGITYHKPDEADLTPEIEDADTNVQNAEEEEVYDEVYEEGQNGTTPAVTEKPDRYEVIESSTNGEEIYDEITEEKKKT